jgi:glycosyltransferase involved in cell wall biosynthesis
MNRLYHTLDRICCDFSDVTWNYSESMIAAREKYHSRKFTGQIVVPNGVHLRPGLKSEKHGIHDIVYLGTLFPRQGIQVVIGAISRLVKKYPDLKFNIIGEGPYRQELENTVWKYKVSGNVRFRGYIADPLKVDRIVTGSALAVALYRPDRNFVLYTEPGKVKHYLACGVPVVMTDISPLSRQIVKNRCGLISRYDAGDLAGIISAYFDNPIRFRSYSENAVKFVRKFEWENIFTEALNDRSLND